MKNPPTNYTDLYGSDPRAIVVRDLMNEIRISHDSKDIPDPYGAVFQDWSSDPFGGGWHSWNIDYVSEDIRHVLRNLPNKDGKNYHTSICGEADRKSVV